MVVDDDDLNVHAFDFTVLVVVWSVFILVALGAFWW